MNCLIALHVLSLGRFGDRQGIFTPLNDAANSMNDIVPFKPRSSLMCSHVNITWMPLGKPSNQGAHILKTISSIMNKLDCIWWLGNAAPFMLGRASQFTDGDWDVMYMCRTMNTLPYTQCEKYHHVCRKNVFQTVHNRVHAMILEHFSSNPLKVWGNGHITVMSDARHLGIYNPWHGKVIDFAPVGLTADGKYVQTGLYTTCATTFGTDSGWPCTLHPVQAVFPLQACLLEGMQVPCPVDLMTYSLQENQQEYVKTSLSHCHDCNDCLLWQGNQGASKLDVAHTIKRMNLLHECGFNSLLPMVQHLVAKNGRYVSCNAAVVKSYVYVCGYKFTQLAQYLTGNDVAPKHHQPTSHDIAVEGMFGPHDCPANFTGTTLHVNGESVLAGPSALKPGKKALYAGPLPSQIPRAMQMYYASETYMTLKPWKRLLNTRKHDLIYAASNCVRYREDMFNLLALVVNAKAGGACCGSHPELRVTFSGRNMYRKNVMQYVNYKFVLAMENKYSPGYITEKIIYAFAAGAVPIYYGTLEVFDLFNHEAFVFIDPARPQSGINLVKYMQANKTAYLQMAQKPVFAPGAEHAYFGSGLKQRFQQMLKSGNTNFLPACSHQPQNLQRWDVFKDVVYALQAVACPFTIHAGTLLNFVRDCELLDSDFDFTIPLTWWRLHAYELESEMKRRNFIRTWRFGQISKFGYEVAWNKAGIKTDFFSRVDDDTAMITGLWVNSKVAHCQTKRAYTATTNWAGIQIRVPMPVEAALTSLYGTEWHVKSNKWNWAQSPFTVGSCTW